MLVRSLSLIDFRSYSTADVDFAPGLTVIVGPNGHGKTNLLEAVGLAAGLGSFRGAVDAALIKHDADSAVVRCRALGDADRALLIEAELSRARPNRLKLNHQNIARRRELLTQLAVTVFSPEDLELVKGEPAGRRRWIDDALAALRPSWGALRSDLDRILRQRNTLLRTAGGRAADDVTITLDVWDSRLAAVGDELRSLRCGLIDEMRAVVRARYAEIAQGSSVADISYVSCWGEGPLAEALAEARNEDLRRGVSTVGPHRDDIALSIDGLTARSHASQGEQRSLAVALRLAVDAQIRERRGVVPVLLLDDVFSELDRGRAEALLRTLPAGQRILTTATPPPDGFRPDHLIQVNHGAAVGESR